MLLHKRSRIISLFFLFVNEKFHPRTKVFNEILDKCKTHGYKKGLGYINKDETPPNGETMLNVRMIPVTK